MVPKGEGRGRSQDRVGVVGWGLRDVGMLEVSVGPSVYEEGTSSLPHPTVGLNPSDSLEGTYSTRVGVYPSNLGLRDDSTQETGVPLSPPGDQTWGLGPLFTMVHP